MNLLELNNDVLNIIGVYVKKDNLERKIIKDRQMRSDKQIINGKEIRFCPYFYGIKDRGTISKDNLKNYIFDNFDNEIKYIKVHVEFRYYHKLLGKKKNAKFDRLSNE